MAETEEILGNNSKSPRGGNPKGENTGKSDKNGKGKGKNKNSSKGEADPLRG